MLHGLRPSERPKPRSQTQKLIRTRGVCRDHFADGDNLDVTPDHRDAPQQTRCADSRPSRPRPGWGSTIRYESAKVLFRPQSRLGGCHGRERRAVSDPGNDHCRVAGRLCERSGDRGIGLPRAPRSEPQDMTESRCAGHGMWLQGCGVRPAPLVYPANLNWRDGVSYETAVRARRVRRAPAPEPPQPRPAPAHRRQRRRH
jgi:hypothetical protein